ncbi:MAG: insulinase family protein [Lachnospiraceae bacterium]|nr:insulinase family protein [Lachnospiraceae bacterium]
MVEVKKMSNGIKVVLEELSYVRTVSFGVWVHVGSANETKENNGIAHMIEHMLFKGTTTKSAKKIADLTSGIGDDVNAFTGKEITSFYGTTVTKHLPVLVDLIGDMLQNSRFDEADIRKEKSVICDEIDMYEDSPEDLVHEVLQQKVWKDQPIGYIISGTKSNVRSYTREQLLAFMEEHYVADNMTISLAGCFETEAVMKQLEEVFGGIKKRVVPAKEKANDTANRIKSMFGKQLALDPYSPRYSYKKEDRVVYHKTFCTRHKEIEQLHVNIGFPSIAIGDKDRYVFSVFNSILGGSNNSRLFQIIREELGLVYSIYSYGSAYEKAGLFQIDITVNSAQAKLVFEKTFEVLQDFLKEGVKEEELATYKEQVKTELIMGGESVKSKMNANAKSVMSEERVTPLDEVLEKVEAVTCENVMEFARKTLDIRNCSVCVVGPKDSEAFAKIKRAWTHKVQEA